MEACKPHYSFRKCQRVIYHYQEIPPYCLYFEKQYLLTISRWFSLAFCVSQLWSVKGPILVFFDFSLNIIEYVFGKWHNLSSGNCTFIHWEKRYLSSGKWYIILWENRILSSGKRTWLSSGKWNIILSLVAHSTLGKEINTLR